MGEKKTSRLKFTQPAVMPAVSFAGQRAIRKRHDSLRVEQAAVLNLPVPRDHRMGSVCGKPRQRVAAPPKGGTFGSMLRERLTPWSNGMAPQGAPKITASTFFQDGVCIFE